MKGRGLGGGRPLSHGFRHVRGGSIHSTFNIQQKKKRDHYSQRLQYANMGDGC